MALAREPTCTTPFKSLPERGLLAPARRVIGYPRVSSDEQAEKGYGLGSQEDRLHAWGAARGVPLMDVIPDDESGLTLDRPGLNRIRELARAGAFDTLLCVRLDRLARANHLRRQVEAELEECGVEVLYTEQTFEATPAGRLQRGIIGELGEYETYLIRERTMDGRRKKAKEKHVMPAGRAAFGFRQITRAEALAIPEFSGRSGEWVIVPEKALFVKELFQRAAAGVSLRKLCAWADTTGHRPLNGGLWCARTIGGMLDNPAYYGKPVFGKRATRRTAKRTPSGKNLKVIEEQRPESEWIWLECPPIVSKALFDAVQERMSTNKQTLGGRPSTRVWPLSGVIFCGCCKGVQGKPLVGFGAVNKDRRTYRCTSLTRKGFTYCRSFYHADTLEEKARRAIREALSPGRLAAIARERAEDANAAVGNPEQRQREIGAELRELKAKEDTLIEMRLEGLSAEAFSRKVAEVNSSRANLEKQLAEVRAQAAQLRDPEEAARAADALAAELSVDLDAALADPVDFKRLARMLLSIRLFTDREPEIEVRVPTVLHPVSG